MVAMGFGLIGPALPALADMFGVGAAVAGLAVSGFALARLITNVILAGVVGRWRLRTVLTAGLLIQAVFSVLAGLSPDFTLLILARLISGAGSAAFTIASTALVILSVPDAVRGRATSVYFASSSAGIVAGPALGGFVTAIDPRFALIGYGLLLLIGGAAGWFALGSIASLKATSGSDGRDEGDDPAQTSAASSPVGRAVLFQLLREPVFVAVLACQFAQGWVYYGMRVTTIPLFMAEIGLTAALIGTALTVAAAVQIASSLTAGPVSDRWNRQWPMLIGLGFGIAAMALWGVESAPWAIVVGIFAYGVASGANSALPPALLGDLPKGGSGIAVSTFWIVFDIAAVLGPIVSGQLMDAWGYPAAFAGGVVVLLIAVAAVIRARPRPARPLTG
ncbi:MFS transporter [Microbacterium aquimaris]|nr:MFS transporter [Microbacterium aquimaris]MDZ8275054.1 MFS transporter [Microbacterium aquimaris]